MIDACLVGNVIWCWDALLVGMYLVVLLVLLVRTCSDPLSVVLCLDSRVLHCQNARAALWGQGVVDVHVRQHAYSAN